MKKYILPTILTILIFATLTQAADLPVMRGPSGGTNTSSTGAGNIGNCLKVSSVNPLVWTIGTCGSGGAFTTTTINGLSATAYTFAVGTDTNIVLSYSTSSPGTITLTPSWATSSALSILRGGTNTSSTPANGQLLIGNGTGYTLGKLATSTTGSDVYFEVGAGTITLHLPNAAVGVRGLMSPDAQTFGGVKVFTDGVQSNSGFLDVGTTGYSFNTDGVILNSSVNGKLQVRDGITAGATTAIFDFTGIRSSNKTFTFPNATGSIAVSRTTPFIIENATSTEDDYVITFDSTSTITKIFAVNKKQGDTITWNLLHDPSRTAATSSAWHVFSADQTTTATTTPDILTTFASSTVNQNSVMRFYTSAASSSQFGITIQYTTP